MAVGITFVVEIREYMKYVSKCVNAYAQYLVWFMKKILRQIQWYSSLYQMTWSDVPCGTNNNDEGRFCLKIHKYVSHQKSINIIVFDDFLISCGSRNTISYTVSILTEF